jgi:hypothetical protein
MGLGRFFEIFYILNPEFIVKEFRCLWTEARYRVEFNQSFGYFLLKVFIELEATC